MTSASGAASTSVSLVGEPELLVGDVDRDDMISAGDDVTDEDGLMACTLDIYESIGMASGNISVWFVVLLISYSCDNGTDIYDDVTCCCDVCCDDTTALGAEAGCCLVFRRDTRSMHCSVR